MSARLRGGSWINKPNYLRASIRDSYPPDFRTISIGFRLARGAGKPLRGGSWINKPNALSASYPPYLDPPDNGFFLYGFRCARTTPK
jgi:formylglycine-generating enzyme required for sulfatase activity